MEKRVFLVAAGRTPIGAFGGAFKDYSAVELGVTCLKQIMARYAVPADKIGELIIGNVLSAGMGMNPARQVGLGAGLPIETPMYGVNQVCGSGLKAVALAAMSIRCGNAELVAAGGIENMSQAPYYLKNARWGGKMNDQVLKDYMVYEGLTDVFNQVHMGMTAERIGELYGISRQEQDEFAVQSQQKCKMAVESGAFEPEITPVSIPRRKGDPGIVNRDEHPRPDTSPDKLAGMAPAFKKEGSVTAGNASGINDGAAMVILAGQDAVDRYHLTPLAEILADASAGVEPMVMGMGPVPAILEALKRAGMTLADIDLFELNEAFAVQSIAVNRELKKLYPSLDESRINVHGGAIALGHPIGASGARILVTLLSAMQKYDKKTGLASLCVGGGMGITMIIQRSGL
ncbi:MAG: acetyl-CoA C-acetyltransferase [Candidatus Delongbacteria bacterium]|nr:acetyl-CoA C-acetyltransferase [Candidatus Delongbacteria bacterium]